MTSEQAAKILDLPNDASPEQLEARFNELRRKLEDKIARAPTPGLQAKYRESLADITTAFETLTLAADSSTLPVAQKQGARSNEQGIPNVGPPLRDELGALSQSKRLAGVPGPDNPKSKTKNRKSGTEFLIVALIALALLGAGGWWVMKTRAENAEQARLAAETLQQKQAAEQAEAARIAALKASLRTKLAEARVDWEARESELQDAERRTSELKSELRGLRDVPAVKKAELSAQVTGQEFYAKWLKTYLLRHPAKLARVKADELLQAEALDEAATVVDEIFKSLPGLSEEVADRRAYFLNVTTRVRLHSKPEGLRWILTDPYGRTHEGVTPAVVEEVPITHLVADGVTVAPLANVEKRGEFTTGKISVRFVRPGWADVVKETTAMWEDNELLEAEFPEGAVAVSSLPAGVPFKITQIAHDRGWSGSGTTPATIAGVPPGQVRVTLLRPGFAEVFQNLEIEGGKTAKTADIDQRAESVQVSVAEPQSKIFVDGKIAGYGQATVHNLVPGEHALQLEAPGYPPYRRKFTIKQQGSMQTQTYSFKQLAADRHTCASCKGAGQLHHQQTCTACRGTSKVDCPDCKNGITGHAPDGRWYTCKDCSAKGTLPCQSCVNGIYRWQTTCTKCGGDGKVSDLQLAQ